MFHNLKMCHRLKTQIANTELHWGCWAVLTLASDVTECCGRQTRAAEWKHTLTCWKYWRQADYKKQVCALDCVCVCVWALWECTCEAKLLPETLLHSSSCTFSCLSRLSTEMISSSNSSTSVSHWDTDAANTGQSVRRPYVHNTHLHTLSHLSHTAGTPFAWRRPRFSPVYRAAHPFRRLCESTLPRFLWIRLLLQLLFL